MRGNKKIKKASGSGCRYLMQRGAESGVIDIIRIIIIATEITLPIRQSCWCAGYGNWKTW